MPQRLDFAAEFNRRLGGFTGNLARDTPENVLRTDIEARAANDAKRLLLAKLLAQKIEEKKALENGDSNSSGLKPAPRLGDLSESSVDRIVESDGFDASNFLTRGPLNALKAVTKAQLEVGGRALDIVSRPSYAVNEAFKERAESLNEGQSELGALDDIAGGLLSGITGKEKTGFGEAVEANASRSLSNNSLIDQVQAASRRVGGSQNPLVELLNLGIGQNETLASKPQANQWLKRTQGLMGDLALDPLNVVGGKAVGKIITAGKEAVPFTRTKYVDEVANAVNEVLGNNGLDSTFRKMKLTGGVNPTTGARVATNRPQGWDSLYKVIEDSIDASMIDVAGGANRGRVLGGEVAPYTLSASVAEGVRSFVGKNFDEFVTKFNQHLDGTLPLTTSQIDKMRKSDPLFDRYVDELLAELNSSRKNKFVNIGNATVHYTKAGGTGPQYMLSKSARAVEATKASTDELIKTVQDELYEKLVGKVYNAPGISIAGKTVASFDRIGKAYEGARRAKLAGRETKGLSFARQFPGRTALMNNRMRSLGTIPYEQLHTSVREMATGLTPAQRKEISQAILNETPLADPKMETARQFIIDEYGKMFREEVEAGVRSAKQQQPSNYVFNYYRKGNRGKEIANYRNVTKQAVAAGGKLPTSHLEEARRLGLKPEDDAFRALLYRKLKSNRDLSRSWFTEDLLDHYGILSNRLSKQSMHGRKLRAVRSNIPDTVKATMKEGDTWYLPEDIYEVYENYLKITRGGINEDTAALLRSYDRVTRIFKSMATVPYPGFHIRNAIGDMFMSHMDGVRSSDYTFLARMIANEKDPNKISQVLIGGKNFSYQDLVELFRKNAASGGFHSTELNSDSIFTKVNPNRISSAIKTGSEMREDFFRFSHFLHAFKEEFPKAVKTVGEKRALQSATDAASYRVNKYLLDYGALTGFERNVLRRAMPFYTYTRKVLPTLLEATFLNPRQLSKTNRLFLDREDGSYQDMLIPEYQREIGYSRLSGDGTEEPWILGGQFLPTDVMKKNTNFTSAGGFFRNILSQANPIPKGVVEMAAGERFFNDRPIDSGGQYAIESGLPFLGPISDLATGTPVTKLPGIKESNKTGLERLLAGRFGFNIPFDQVSTDQQTAAVYGQQEKLFEELGKINEQIQEAGYRLYLSKRLNGTTYRIRDEETGEVVFETDDPNKAAERAMQLSK